MTDLNSYPRMPDDWMPESLLVVGKQGAYELAFVLEVDDHGGIMETAAQQSLLQLRLYIWQAIHNESLGEVLENRQ